MFNFELVWSMDNSCGFYISAVLILIFNTVITGVSLNNLLVCVNIKRLTTKTITTNNVIGLLSLKFLLIVFLNY